MQLPEINVPIHKIRVIVCDLDGTLYDQKKLRLLVLLNLFVRFITFRTTYLDLKIIDAYRKCRDRHLGYSSTDILMDEYKTCADELNISTEKVQQCVEKLMHKIPLKFLKYTIYPGVREFFDLLNQKKLKIAIYSDYPVKEKLQALHLKSHLYVCSTDEGINHLKPDKTALLYICKSFNCEPDEVLYVGDRNETDGESATRAGNYFIKLDVPAARKGIFYNYLFNLIASTVVVKKTKIIRHYIYIARLDHWFKNIFMLPGIIMGLYYSNFRLENTSIGILVAGILATCLIASANYVINEWLDMESDRFHPVKKNRPAVKAGLKPLVVYTEYVLIAAVGLLISYHISTGFFLTEIFFLLMGFLYNVPPFRAKDKPYLDVLSESINNPIRFILGWFLTGITFFPPSSILVAYWMGGAFLMSTKRFAEYRFIDDASLAGKYRKSFSYYDENKLLIATFFYALCSSFFLAIFLVKHRIELLISFPFFAILFAWYLKIGFEKDSIVQSPEKLYLKKAFIGYVVFLFILLVVLLKIDIPSLKWFLIT